MNISLLSHQVKFIDELVQKHQFANRSELFRSILRLLKTKPELVGDAATHPFIAPKKRSVKSIVKEFRNTKRYSPEFLKELEEGLSGSTYFRQ